MTAVEALLAAPSVLALSDPAQVNEPGFPAVLERYLFQILLRGHVSTEAALDIRRLYFGVLSREESWAGGWCMDNPGYDDFFDFAQGHDAGRFDFIHYRDL